MIFAKKNITVRAYDFGYGFQSLVYDNVISVDNVDLYTLMTNTIKYGDKEYKDIIEFMAANDLYHELVDFNIDDYDQRALKKILDAHSAEYNIYEVDCENGETYIGYYNRELSSFTVDLSGQQYLRIYAQRYSRLSLNKLIADVKYVGAIPRDDSVSEDQIKAITKAIKCKDKDKTFKYLLAKMPKENLYLDIDGEDELVPIEAKMTKIQGIQILRLGHTNYQVGSIRYDAELGKYKTLGGETFRVVYMINPERV